MSFTSDQYLALCKRRFGAANPERIDNPLWEWMVRSGLNPYWARQELGVDSDAVSCAMPGNPDWCFDRIGAPTVTLDDGRTITIAGEHEDYYDPDFCIYNDVVVTKGDDVEIYGYPADVFPPTDFQSATLIDDQIWLIGSVGYVVQREYG